MQHLTFGPIQPHDINILQQIIQGTEFSNMSFNRHAGSVFIARNHGNIAGFASGQKGYGDQSHVLTVRGTYLFQQYDDVQHQNELQLALITWAEDALRVTHYKLHECDTPKPIGISHIIPPQNIDIPAAEEELPPEIIMTAPDREYAYG